MPMSLTSMSARVKRDPEFRDAFLADPQTVLDTAARHLPNTSVYRWVVGSLGAALILSILAAVAVLVLGRGPEGQMPEVPDLFVTSTSTIIGALAGLLFPQS